MSRLTVEDYSQWMVRAQVFVLSPRERAAIAQKLEAGLVQVPLAGLNLIAEEAIRSSRDAVAGRAILASTIQGHGVADLLEIVQDIESRVTEKASADTHPSMEHVTESNPYGWPPSCFSRMQALDHEVPGEWNGFRQGFNMTTEEARLRGLKDVRRHGCSRVEVVGEFDKARIKDDEMNSASAEWVVPRRQKMLMAPMPERECYGG